MVLVFGTHWFHTKTIPRGWCERHPNRVTWLHSAMPCLSRLLVIWINLGHFKNNLEVYIPTLGSGFLVRGLCLANLFTLIAAAQTPGLPHMMRRWMDHLTRELSGTVSATVVATNQTPWEEIHGKGGFSCKCYNLYNLQINMAECCFLPRGAGQKAISAY